MPSTTFAWTLGVASLVGVIGLFASAQTAGDSSAGLPAEASQGVAVVELFTSQGCSSCPPADRVLTAIDTIANERGLPIYTLSMHVDYWNYLGWSDPYSAEQFSDRQRSYARAANSSRIYTPQMIVNGQTEFTGSNGRTAEQAIVDALNAQAQSRVELTAQPRTGGSAWRVAYDVTGATPGSDLVVCLVADAGGNHVPHGENAGRTLAHRSVVRAISSVPLNQGTTGSTDIRLPAGQSLDSDAEIVAFVQSRSTKAISGAAKVAARR